MPANVSTRLRGLFALAWMFVICVSVIDGYLVLYFREVIEDFEQNPVGLALLGERTPGTFGGKYCNV